MWTLVPAIACVGLSACCGREPGNQSKQQAEPPVLGHFGADELHHVLYAVPLDILYKAANDSRSRDLLYRVMMHKCEYLESMPNKRESIRTHLWGSGLFTDDAFNHRIRMFGCAEVRLDDGEWYTYSFEAHAWQRK